MSHLSENIKKIRKLQKLTQEKFSTQMQVSVAMQKSYESGKASPNVVYLENLSAITLFPVRQLREKDLSIKELQANMNKVAEASGLNMMEESAEYNLFDVQKFEEIKRLRIEKAELELLMRKKDHLITELQKKIIELQDSLINTQNLDHSKSKASG